VWFPLLSPSPQTVKLGQAAETPAQWHAFGKKYRSKMAAPEPARAIQLLAALSQHSNFSVGCYCGQEEHCHRSVLRDLLKEQGAKVVR